MSEPFSPEFPQLLIDGRGDATFSVRVRQVLRRMLYRQTGSIILRELRDLRAQVTVVFWTGQVSLVPGVSVTRQNAYAQLTGPRQVRIDYNTAPWMHRRLQDGTMRVGPGWSADSVLCHELVHAVRLAAGFGSTVPTFPNCPPEPEEFCAIHVTNVYLSEANEALVASHSGNAILDTASFLRYPPNVELVRWFVNQQPGFFGRIAGVRSSFNPFAQVSTR